MAIPVRFSKDDFLVGKQVKPGYYHALVKGIVSKPAKSDGSAVYNIQLKILTPGDYYGIPLIDYMSEKAMGMGAIRFIRACNNGEEPKADTGYDLDNGKGKIVKIHVINSLYNGRIVNNVDDYEVPDVDFKSDE